MHEIDNYIMKFCFLSWLKIFLIWYDSWINSSDWYSVGVSIVQWYLVANNPNLTSSIHDHQKTLSPSPNPSFHKNNSLGLLSKSNHLTKFVLSSEEVLVTLLPYFSHLSPSLIPKPPSKSLIFLSAESCTNIGDLVRALGHLVGQPIVTYFEAELWKMHLGR